MSDVPQDELRRRLRAARALQGVTIEELAERLPDDAQLGQRTLRKLESGELPLRPQVALLLARALGIPSAWFRLPSLIEYLNRAEQLADERMAQRDLEIAERFRETEENFNERLAALEREIGLRASTEADDSSSPSAASPPRARARRTPRSVPPAGGR